MRRVLRISTRGYYDLTTGVTLRHEPYRVWPKRDFEELAGSKEITIMIHGLRNDNAGAIAKVLLAERRLRRLGYPHPVIGYSYDSNTAGAHLARHAGRALAVGQRIAVKNGRNLGRFIRDFKRSSPGTKIRLMGHSLGSLVILSALEHLARGKNAGIVEGVYLFGASIPCDVPSSKKYGRILQFTVRSKIVNHYAPTDQVLGWAESLRYVEAPLGLCGAVGKPVKKYRQRMVRPKNHRFASYAAVLGSFP